MSNSQKKGKVYRQPHDPPTPEANVHLVVLGSTLAGIRPLKECPKLPIAQYGGRCFPLTVYCRSRKEADLVWGLQRHIRRVEEEDEQTITSALLSNPFVCAMLGERRIEEQEFFASMFSKFDAPCIFLSWADAYKYVDDYQFGKIVETQTLVDALVYLCKKPYTRSNLETVISYERPTAQTNTLELLVGSLALGENGNRSEEDDPSDVSTLSTSPAGTAVNEASLLAGPHVNVGSHPPPLSQVAPIPLPAINNHVFMHARDIRGHVIMSYTECPPQQVLVPCLGTLADHLVDALGYTPSTITRFHMTYLDAAQLKHPERYFVNQMVQYGMPRREASMWWEIIEVTLGDNREVNYRQRVDLGIP